MAARSVLLIAFQFPPMRGSSAIQRTLRFAQHLPKFGWTPIVLTATPGAYEQVATGPDSDTGAIEVHRARALDAARHLSLFGRYPRGLAIPDRWVTLKFSAVSAALRLIREQATLGLDVDTIARQVGLSRSVLQRRFRELLDRTVHDAILDAHWPGTDVQDAIAVCMASKACGKP